MDKINRYLKNIASKCKESNSTDSCYYWLQIKDTEYRIRCSDHFSYSKVNMINIIKCNDDTYVISLRSGFFLTCNNDNIISTLKAILLLLPNIIVFIDNVSKNRKNLAVKYDQLMQSKNSLESKLEKITEAHTKSITNKSKVLEKIKEVVKELDEVS